MAKKQAFYWIWIREEAEIANSDGCSWVPDWRIDCCFEHDLAYAYAKDPRDAYRQWRTASAVQGEGSPQYWIHAKPITRKETDRRFRVCNQSKSRFGRCSPMAAWRWLGVRILGRKIWMHRHG